MQTALIYIVSLKIERIGGTNHLYLVPYVRSPDWPPAPVPTHRFAPTALPRLSHASGYARRSSRKWDSYTSRSAPTTTP